MIRTTPEQRDEMRRAAQQPKNLYRNEKVWTLLVADALDRAPDQGEMCRQLCGQDVALPHRLDVWFEAQPASPRKGTRGQTEGNTRLDMAFGSVAQRGSTGAGIAYGAHREDSWACFVESKCFSDVSSTVSYDPRRNQLTRVIENALCFRGQGGAPAKLFITLLTPRVFMEDPFGRRSRLYGYKMDEYKGDPSAIRRDIDGCSIDWRVKGLNLDEAISRLHLNWVSFEDLLEPQLGTGLDITRNPSQVTNLADLVREASTRASDDAAAVPLEG